jgi:hypothetical protein
MFNMSTEDKLKNVSPTVVTCRFFVWSVNSTMEKAIESQKELNDMRVGGAVTKIIEEKVN